MIQVIFHNLEKSEMVRNVLGEIIEGTLEKFPHAERGKVQIYASKENSLTQAGKDHFTVKLVVHTKYLKPIVLTKGAESLYQAAALVSDKLLETLHRAFDKKRTVRRDSRRKFKNWEHTEHLELESELTTNAS